MTVILRNGRLGVGVDQLGAAPDDAGMLLADAGQEAGHVDERQDRHVERIAGADEARRLLRRVDVEAAGELGRLVGDDADRMPLDPSEADDDVRREQRVHLAEVAVVEQVLDDLVHVVGLVGRIGDERVEERVVLVHHRRTPSCRIPAADRGCCSAGTTAAT